MPSIIGRDVGSTGFGLMSLTLAVGPPIPREQAFAAMNAALETGANFWNGGLFYGTPEDNSLHLLRDYFTKYPENAEKIVLSIKAGLNSEKIPDGSDSWVRHDVENCLRILPQSLKKIDIFQCARVDPNMPVERTMQTLKSLIEEGKFNRVGLSEVKAETIKRANSVVPIAAVEVEFSLFETNILHNSVASTCAELGIPVIAYSPLGRGMLTGKITALTDFPEKSPLRRLYRLQGENFEQNIKLIKELKRLSEEYTPYTMANIALSWVRGQSQEGKLPVILPISGSSKAKNVRENSIHVPLTYAEFDRINKVLEENPIVGERAYPGQTQYVEG